MIDGYYYNEHRSKNGDGKYNRRWLCGNPQKPHIRVTSDEDIKSLENEDNIKKDDEKDDNLHYFEKLAS
jgi:hypothetical protein